MACPDGFWSTDLRAVARQEINWLGHGYLATGGMPLWTSRWKAGKTTWLSVLLARRVTGGPLAGLAVRPGRTAPRRLERPVRRPSRRAVLSLTRAPSGA